MLLRLRRALRATFVELATAPIWSGVGAIVASLYSPSDTVSIALGAGVGLLVGGLLHDFADPPHAHCDDCDSCAHRLCPTGPGDLPSVPNALRRKRQDAHLIAAGWAVDGDSILCPPCRAR